jgi:chorismate dehydratase
MNEISGTTAGIIIGDRALASLNRFEHIYDLGLAWKAYTRLPFVFAAWVANKPIPLDFMEAFDAANAYGLTNLEEVIALIPASEQVYDLHKYYTENISYTLTAEKKKGLQSFLKLIQP